MIHSIAVIGAGTMGRGIALVFAMHGYPVALYEPHDAVLGTALQKIRADMEFMAAEAYIAESAIEETINNITLFSALEAAVASADYVIEAVPEDLPIKQELFQRLDSYCPAHTVLATNTSSLRLSDIMGALAPARKARCMVSHWYNPGHLIPVVELSVFGNMEEQVFNDVLNMYVKCGKQPIRVLKDIPGMIANRILHAQAREVFHLMEMQAASAEDIDRALMYGPAFRNATTGMLETADMGGLDIWLIGEDNLLPDLCGDNKACDMLRAKVAEGKLGLKSGEGFFDYPQNTKEAVQKAFHKRLITQLKASKTYTP